MPRKKISKTVAAKTAVLAEREESPVKKAARERARDVTASAATKSVDQIVRATADLKVSIGGTIDEITNRLSIQLAELATVTEAITAKKAELAQLHEIEVQVGTLEALYLSQETEAAEFQQEMEATRATVEASQAATATERKREEEQYQYNKQKNRLLDADEWTKVRAKREADMERELDRRVEEVEQREKLMDTLVEANGSLSQELVELKASQKAEVEKAVAIATSSLKRDLTSTFALEKKDLEVKNQLLQAEVSQVQARNVELKGQVDQSAVKVQDAQKMLQAITEKAFESAAQQKVQVYQTSDNASTGRRAA